MIAYLRQLYHGSKMFTLIEEGMAALRSVLELAKSKEGKINPETVTADAYRHRRPTVNGSMSDAVIWIDRAYVRAWHRG
jgi:hypothetical protein